MSVIHRFLRTSRGRSTRTMPAAASRASAAALAVVLSAPGMAAAADAPRTEDTAYYISLGDSLAAGYQPDSDKDMPIAYTDRLFEQLKQREPRLQHIRLGCTGETTASLIKGGKCDYPNATSQLDAAAKAMTEHRGKVAYVTIDIGANDIRACATPTGSIDPACLSSASRSVAGNLAQITGALRKAGAEGTQYAGATYYNPFLAAWFLGESGQETAKGSVPLIDASNAAISQVYTTGGFKTADVAGAFSSGEFDPMIDLPGYGEVPTNVARVCELTWTCAKQDPHPNPAGHKVIASAFAAVLQKTTPTPTNTSTASPTPTKASTVSPTASPTPTSSQTEDADQLEPAGELAETGSSGIATLAWAAGAIVVAGAATSFLVRGRKTSSQSESPGSK